MNFGFTELLIMPFFSLVPLVVLYFVVKFAIKNAVKELKNEGYL